MCNSFSKLFILTLAVFFAVGCGAIQTTQDNTKSGNQNSNVFDKTRDALGMKKTGIAECDEVIDQLAAKNKGNSGGEDSWQNKAMTEAVKQQIYNYARDETTVKTEKEKADLTAKCKIALTYLKTDAKK